MYPEEKFGYLGRYIGFAQQQDCSDIIKLDLPPIEERLDELLTQFNKSLPNSKTHPYVAEERITDGQRQAAWPV